MNSDKHRSQNIPSLPWDKHQTFSASWTISEINKVLKNPQKDYFFKLAEFCNQLEDARDSFREKHRDQPEILFKKMSQFLNVMFRSFYIKKLYNNAPNLSLEEFSNSSLFSQFSNNILDKENHLLWAEEAQWWNCKLRAIFLKNFIDEWKIKGLETKFIKNGLHWIVGIKYNNEYFIWDIPDKKTEPVITQNHKILNSKVWDTSKDSINKRNIPRTSIEIKLSYEKNIPLHIEIFQHYISINGKEYPLASLSKKQLKEWSLYYTTEEILAFLFEDIDHELLTHTLQPILYHLGKKIDKDNLLSILSTGVFSL